LSTAAKVVDTAQSPSTDSSHYVISATPKVEGAKIDRGVSRRIRQVGRGDFFVGTG
jgi:predicted methyltransferase